MTSVLASLVAAVLASPVSTGSEWPVARHDSQRTAFVSGTTDIVQPGEAWRYYLGGELTNSQYWAGDIDGSGNTSAVYIGGGRVIAKHPDDTVVWTGPQLALNTIVDVWDVDGDGILDVVASGAPGTLVILSGLNGSLEWTMPSSAGISTVGQVLTADLTGDGKRDLLAVECGCCTLVGSSAAAAFDFSSGFAATQQPLWTIPAGSCNETNLVTDINGDGQPDVIRIAGGAMVAAYNGSTGQMEWYSTPNAQGSLSYGSGLVAPGTTAAPFVLYYQNGYVASVGEGGKRLLAYAYNPVSAALQEQWEYLAGSNPTSDEIKFDASSLGLFDSTGNWEVAFSAYDSIAARWTLVVLDGASGGVLATAPNAVYQGAADINADGVTEILATVSGTLTSFKLQGGALQSQATAAGEVTTLLNRGLAAWEYPASPVATTTISGGGRQNPVLISNGQPGAYEAVDLSPAGAGGILASFQAKAGLSYLATNLFVDPVTQLPQPFLGLSSGYLAVLDPTTFQPTNMGGSSRFPVHGLRTGGFYSGPGDIGATPTVSHLSQCGVPSVVSQESSGVLVRLDPGTSASVASPPTPVWSLPCLGHPSLVDLTGAGFPDVVAVGDGGVYAYSADGQTLLWSSPLPGVSYDLPFGDVNGDGIPDIFYEWDNYTGGIILEMNVLDGKTGTPIWSPSYAMPIRAGMLPMAVADLTGSGVSDAISGTSELLYLSGSNGAVLAEDPSWEFYYEPLVSDVLGLGRPQVFMNGGYLPPVLAEADGGVVWGVDAGSHWTHAYAALAPCDGGSLLIEGEFSSPVLHAYSAATGAEVWRQVLVGGQEYSAASAVPTGAFVGGLGNATVKQDLTGTGHVDALIGSTDGYLYAVKACSGGTIEWTYDFGYPVGEPIVADSTGTGEDQVLVSVADGYLYALTDKSLPPPCFANASVSGTSGIPSPANRGKNSDPILSVEWASVAGAQSYEWAVYTSAGVAVNSYQSGGYSIRTLPGGSQVVDLDATGITIEPGGLYYFGVRAVGPNGTSSDAVSNTVTVPGSSRSTVIWTPPVVPRLVERLFRLFR